MGEIGLQELLLILVIALLVFGPKRLPELGRTLGRAIREFLRASEEFRSTLETRLQLNKSDPVPSPSVLSAPEPPPTPVETAPGPVPDGAGGSGEPYPANAAPVTSTPGSAAGRPASASRIARISSGPIGLSDLRPGDFVAVELSGKGKRAEASAVTVTFRGEGR